MLWDHACRDCLGVVVEEVLGADRDLEVDGVEVASAQDGELLWIMLVA